MGGDWPGGPVLASSPSFIPEILPISKPGKVDGCPSRLKEWTVGVLSSVVTGLSPTFMPQIPSASQAALSET